MFLKRKRALMVSLALLAFMFVTSPALAIEVIIPVTTDTVGWEDVTIPSTVKYNACTLIARDGLSWKWAKNATEGDLGNYDTFEDRESLIIIKSEVATGRTIGVIQAVSGSVVVVVTVYRE